MRRRLAASLAVVAAAALALSGCSSVSTGAAATPTAPAPSTTGVTGTITVFAAASLTTTFTELGSEFEKANPGAKVAFSFAGSSDLVSQLTAGAPADVFASADEANMAKAASGGVIDGSATDFATNVLAIAVPPGNPAKVKSFADLASPSIKTVVCAPQVPCGAATAKVEKSAGVTLSPVSQESSVTDVLGKVSSGEADAGIVYATDVKGAGSKVGSVPFPEAAKTLNVYPIATVAHAPNAPGARAFVAFVTGPDGRKALAAAGFGAP
ncbi:molybdate ABC transporter substrate-binding protein [Leifsonia sp. fls2-241-R2A-40a]|uniref:molybdate ABC transporter substrate-binding protein n=1 Tax=Leifsonia sp. fls2-241-R2A-40a TaxID=3040290 RepID=UPI00254EFD52|nr:molybdate ABC transporter substrate-binding protein [Leifsonia sp. fls2-241-R2A-40a]